MTTLNTVKEGFNKYCGPAVLSILTGRNTDECAGVISSISGDYKVKGVELNHLLRACHKMGFDYEDVIKASGWNRSLYFIITQIVDTNGIYVITIPKHFIVIEVQDKKVFFCDNHTKEPIPASSSARLMSTVLACYRVFERRKPVKINESIQVLRLPEAGGAITIKVYRLSEFDMPEANTRINLSYFTLHNENELESLITQLSRGY